MSKRSAAQARFAAIEAQARQFIRRTLSCNDQNTAAIQQHVNRMYSSMGLAHPKIVWCASPLQMTVIPLYMNLFLSLDFVLGDELKKVVRNHQSGELIQSLWNNICSVTASEFCGNLPALGADLFPTFIGYLTALRSREASNEDLLQDCLKIASDFTWLTSYLQSLRHAADAAGRPPADMQVLVSELFELQNALSIPVERDAYRLEHLGISDCCWGAWFDAQGRPSIFHSLLDRTRSTGEPDIHSFLDMYWIIAGTAARSSKSMDETEFSLYRLLESGMAFRFFENVCFVCRYPIVAHVDQDSLFHNASGPAIEFADGLKIYLWHGTVVPPSLIQNQKQITSRAIDLEPNVEMRRVMLEMYGLENYFSRSRAKKIHQDECGALYRKELPYGESIQFVEVSNSTPNPDGTRRRYILRVSPEVKTAREAVAWTFGLSEEEYQPNCES